MSDTPLSELLECISDGGGNTGMILRSARAVCGASPTITTTNGFATVARGGVGDYTATFDGAFAAAPVCWATAEGSADAYNVQIHSISTTQVRVLVFNDAGAAADCTAIHIFALGA